MNKKRLIGYLLVIVSVGCIHAQEKKLSVPEYKLWYDCPAQVWTEALPDRKSTRLNSSHSV